MDRHGIRHARAALATALILPLSAGRALASPRSRQPLVIRGAQIPELIGQRTSRFEALAAHGARTVRIRKRGAARRSET